MNYLKKRMDELRERQFPTVKAGKLPKRRPRPVGRPRRRDEPVRVHVRLPGALHEWIKKTAKEYEVNESDVIAVAVQFYYEKMDPGAGVDKLFAKDVGAATRLRIVRRSEQRDDGHRDLEGESE